MKTTNLFVLTLATLVAITVQPFSSRAQTGCGMQSTKSSTPKMDKERRMGMPGDMPMCCKKMMGRKAMTEAQDGAPEPTMESMAEQKGKAAEQASKEVKDPVCLMKVDPNTAERSVYKGKTYYFCSKEDKEAFEKSPEKYVKQEKPGKKP